jgi:hypothetical protein
MRAQELHQRVAAVETELSRLRAELGDIQKTQTTLGVVQSAGEAKGLVSVAGVGSALVAEPHAAEENQDSNTRSSNFVEDLVAIQATFATIGTAIKDARSAHPIWTLAKKASICRWRGVNRDLVKIVQADV